MRSDTHDLVIGAALVIGIIVVGAAMAAWRDARLLRESCPAEPSGAAELAELEAACKATDGIWRWGMKRDPNDHELRFYASCLPDMWP